MAVRYKSVIVDDGADRGLLDKIAELVEVAIVAGRISVNLVCATGTIVASRLGTAVVGGLLYVLAQGNGHSLLLSEREWKER